MQNITNKLYQFIKPYIAMEINGTVINCPYWMNKRRHGELIRGFGNGKGEALEIKEKLEKTANLQTDLYKLARRERVGIDCSGFVYRALNYIIPNLDSIFEGGINRTNAAKLTNKKYSMFLDKINDIRAGDMIRMRGGKHVALIIEEDDKKIIYAHSSSERHTATQGVHLGEIQIIDARKSLSEQIWLEKLKDGKSINRLYFLPEKGDGVFRLKVHG